MLSASNIGTSCGEHQREYLYKIVITKDPIAKLAVPHYQEVKDNLDLYNVKGLFPDHTTASETIKWGGETYVVATVDESSKTGELTFRLDEDGKILEFLEGMKGLTGDAQNHAQVTKQALICDLEIYQVSVDKETITNATKLENVQFLSRKELTVDKEATGVSTVTAGIAWDKSPLIPGVRGKKI